MNENTDTRMRRIGYRPPLDVAEPDQLVLVEYVSGGRLATITLNRRMPITPSRPSWRAQLIEILETVAARPSVRVAILTGAGDRAFSVGGDLYQRKKMTKEEWLRQCLVFDRASSTRYASCAGRSSSVVHGMAYGGGCEIAISTDFIIASEEADPANPSDGRFERRWRSPVFLSACLPPGKAMQMLMTGEPITAQEGYRRGMVNEVLPKAELMNVVLSIAEKIADNSPTAVQAVKRAVQMGQGEPVEQAVAIMMDEHWRR